MKTTGLTFSLLVLGACAQLKPDVKKESFLVGDLIRHGADGMRVGRGTMLVHRVNKNDFEQITEKGRIQSQFARVNPSTYESILTRQEDGTYDLASADGTVKGEMRYTTPHEAWEGKLAFPNGEKQSYSGSRAEGREYGEATQMDAAGKTVFSNKTQLWDVGQPVYQQVEQALNAPVAEGSHLYYVGESVVINQANKQVMEKDRVLLKRRYLPAQRQILESVKLVDLTGHRPVREFQTTITCRVKGLVCDVTDAQNGKIGTMTYKSDSFKQWTYSLKIARGTIRGKGALDEVGIKAGKQLALIKPKLNLQLNDDLREVGEVEYLLHQLGVLR